MGYKLRKNNTYIFIASPDGNSIQSRIFNDLNDDSKYGIKKISINNENNYSERIIDKESLITGSKKEKCCF